MGLICMSMALDGYNTSKHPIVKRVPTDKNNEELLRFSKDSTKTFEKLLKEKRFFESEKSKLLSKINELELEVKNFAKAKESYNVLGIAPVAIINRQLPFEYTIPSRSTDVVAMSHTVQNINHSAFRSMFEISGNNFNDWFRQLNGMRYMIHTEVACLMLGSMTPELLRQFKNSSRYEMLQELKSMFEKQAGVKWIPKETMGYYFYFPPKNKIVVARYAEFFEKNLITQEVSERAIDLEEIQDEDTSPSEIMSEIPMEVEGFEPHQEEDILIRSYKAAMLDSESNKWIDAMNAEIQSMMDNMVWVLVNLPPGCKTVGSKWIFKKKTGMDGIVHTYKARLVAKGYAQLYGVDYKEMFSPVADIRAIRILIYIAAYYDYEILKMDIKTAFLNGYLDEDIYMVQPEGFVDPNHPRKASGSNVTFLILYVDDIIIMGNHILSLQSVKDYLGKCFAMKDLGEATFILGIKIYRDRSKRLIGLGQNAYMDKILKRYKMDNSKRGHIPMQERLDLKKTQGASTPKEVKCMQNVPYASAVVSFIYTVRCTRPDVAFAQNITSRFQQNPGESHWTAVKNILKYLRNTKDMFLVYGGNPKAELRVDCYCNAGFEIDIDDMKSLTGYVFVLNGSAVD
ncbi:retrotransposon protein, putative, ty1-copia subclass [Tanacetum coccineum]